MGDMEQEKLQAIPLVFAFKQVVVGDGFVAGVQMNGRALLETEHVNGNAEEWITGIAPVGITGGGSDRSVAFIEFRNAWIEVLFDIAAKASSFKDFRAACVQFLETVQGSLTKLWEDAVAEVRRQHYIDPSLRREEGADKHPVKFEVVQLTRALRADQNQVEPGLKVAA